MNDLSNLEWCTPFENYNHSINVLGNCQTANNIKGADHYCSRKISAILPDGSIENFDCITDAVKKYNLSSGNATSVLKGRRKHTKGLVLKYR